jgi:two-component system, cell cycle sensor histidine kinase and response regulator CckA
MIGDRIVLLVDDEPDILELASDLLREQGYRFLSAANADIALIILQQPSITFDLLITDVIMPGALDGVGLAVEACRIIPDLRIIYMTGYGGIADARFREAPPGAVLPKPWGVKQFLQAVDAALVTPADLS